MVPESQLNDMRARVNALKGDNESLKSRCVYETGVIVNSFADTTAAAEARDAFKAKYPNRSDFQGAWLLYRVY